VSRRSTSLTPDWYTCTADTLVLAGAARSEFTRVR
jgi:hypothetical protein